MKFMTYLNKFFDVEAHSSALSDLVEGETSRENVAELWVYEKGQDSEPLLILRDAQALRGVDGWIICDIYSTCADELVISEPVFKAMVKKGEVKSRY